jgi:glycosyltransferase involved in cell wall biosynthesis
VDPAGGRIAATSCHGSPTGAAFRDLALQFRRMRRGRDGSRSIALVVPGLGHGGLERIVRDVALGLPRRGFAPSVFCTSKLGVHADDLARAGIRVTLCRDPAPRLRGLPLRLIRELRRLRPELVHAHSGAWIPVGIATLFLRAPRLVLTAHGQDASRWPVVTRWVARRADRVTAVSSSLATDLRQRLQLRRDVDVILNGVDRWGAPLADSRSELRAGRGVASTDLLVLAVGRLEPVKGHAVLLEAFQQALRRAPRLRLAILGTGSLEGPLRTKSRELGIADRVGLLGFRRDAPEWMRSADIFVMPSRDEGMPIALLEAMACGLPVVASAVPGIVETLGSPPAGELVPPDDVESLAAALVRVSENAPARASLAAAAERRASAFSIDAAVDGYCSVYRQLLG